MIFYPEALEHEADFVLPVDKTELDSDKQQHEYDIDNQGFGAPLVADAAVEKPVIVHVMWVKQLLISRDGAALPAFFHCGSTFLLERSPWQDSTTF